MTQNDTEGQNDTTRQPGQFSSSRITRILIPNRRRIGMIRRTTG